MTAIVGTNYVDTANATAHTFSVPTGVTSAMAALFISGASTGGVNPITWTTSGSGTFSTLDSQVATNTYAVVATGSGFVAGDTITATTGTARNITVGHYYDDTVASYGQLS